VGSGSEVILIMRPSLSDRALFRRPLLCVYTKMTPQHGLLLSGNGGFPVGTLGFSRLSLQISELRSILLDVACGHLTHDSESRVESSGSRCKA
ncbi:MAG TPA: hypothetical protein VJW73_08170, partial [Gemmatimonadaceae bacterium]|nr:hypothetical protein [Gemmatimonadaceae bacterium]